MIIESKKHVQVSVPSRGNGVIDMPEAVSLFDALARFPSPLGEMGLSIVIEKLKHMADNRRSFRPLSGKWGYRLACATCGVIT